MAEAFDVEMVQTLEHLSALAAELGALPGERRRIALDTESNGMFAFRPSLCVLQLAWEGERGPRVAVVDTLAVSCAPLRPVLEAASTTKVLHDVHFDVRLLQANGVVLAGVRDTSISARYLGAQATGLAAVLEAELGVRIEKSLQRHDWSRRPLTPVQIDYLAADVCHLLALDERLAAREREAGIHDEVEVETRYRVAVSLELTTPSPPHLRIRGALALGAPARAVLRRLAAWREAEAERADRPPHQILPSDVLLSLATERPRGDDALRRVGRGAARYHRAIARAIAAGEEDGDLPAEELASYERPPAPPARLRACERAISRFRAEEAERRGVTDQVVLPGHCASRIARAALTVRDEEQLASAIGELEGLGPARFERYGRALAGLLAAVP